MVLGDFLTWNAERLAVGPDKGFISGIFRYVPKIGPWPHRGRFPFLRHRAAGVRAEVPTRSPVQAQGSMSTTYSGRTDVLHG